MRFSSDDRPMRNPDKGWLKWNGVSLEAYLTALSCMEGKHFVEVYGYPENAGNHYKVIFKLFNGYYVKFDTGEQLQLFKSKKRFVETWGDILYPVPLEEIQASWAEHDYGHPLIKHLVKVWACGRQPALEFMRDYV